MLKTGVWGLGWKLGARVAGEGLDMSSWILGWEQDLWGLGAGGWPGLLLRRLLDYFVILLFASLVGWLAC